VTYFGFLLRFLVLPIALLAVWAVIDFRRGRLALSRLGPVPVLAATGLHVFVALIYTTPWDNYLVATGVWWYDPDLVSGLVIGWVPIEEYTFFILQPILAGLWWWFIARRVREPVAPGNLRQQLRVLATAALGPIWLASLFVLVSGWEPGTYLALELGWALPPIGLQLIFGADILWRHRHLVALALLPPTFYLAGMDAIAIGAGTWTIDPAQSLQIMLGGVLPLEEFIFFVLTNTLIVFGVTLLLAEESRARLALIRARLQTAWAGQDRQTVEE
jgi:lycopene beta-cyclase